MQIGSTRATHVQLLTNEKGTMEVVKRGNVMPIKCCYSVNSFGCNDEFFLRPPSYLGLVSKNSTHRLRGIGLLQFMNVQILP